VCPLLVKRLLNYTDIYFFFLFLVSRNFIHVRTSPTLLTTYSSADESLLNVCRSYTSSDKNVVRAVIYSKEGFDQRTQIKRDTEERMGRTTCMYIVLTCGLILCLAPCCFPCCKSINPKLDEMALCQQVQERYRTNTKNDSSIDTYTFTTTDVNLASEAILKE
jgi:hypothetical protein